jgi:hypothetical protein
MGPPENPTRHLENQEAGRRKRMARRPRMRWCLLKGCEQRFHPRQARQRYCSAACREAAREWSRWKAQERYRATTAGKQKRNGQNRRYRELLNIGNGIENPGPLAVDDLDRNRMPDLVTVGVTNFGIDSTASVFLHVGTKGRERDQ